MRSHHDPVIDAARLLSAFGVTLPAGVELDPGSADGTAAFIVQAGQPVTDALGDVRVGSWGRPSAFAQQAGPAAQARHCRVETMKSDPTFRESWWSGRRCVVPVERLTEWCYVSGRLGLWGIRGENEAPMGLAGLWKVWTHPTGDTALSFCVLTLSADGHAIFDRLKHPAHDKRMPVILSSQAQRQWLHGSWAQAERLLVRCPAEQLHAFPLEPASGPARLDGPDEADMFADEWWATTPHVPSKKRIAVRRKPVDAPLPTTGDLFS
ncbi:MAG TPA: SOS response-associated peptidase family protein [Roseateles sp.]|uniref:SOS response-associated peptidase family protein n=1 Tax=Roseateles sp. TaxID=1971397 RepID=UPI002EDB2AF5